MGKLKDITVGDVFAIKIENTNYYYFGRVLFDVKEQYIALRDNDNYFDWFSKSVLIETYKYVSKTPEIDSFEPVITRVFIEKRDLLGEEIIKLENRSVDPKKINFPETFKDVDKKGILFATGELAFQTSFDTDFVDKNARVFPSTTNTYYVQLATLDYSGNRDLIEDKEDIMDDYFKWSDLKLHPNVRNEVYKNLNEDSNQTYYELALKHGYDLSRFY